MKRNVIEVTLILSREGRWGPTDEAIRAEMMLALQPGHCGLFTRTVWDQMVGCTEQLLCDDHWIPQWQKLLREFAVTVKVDGEVVDVDTMGPPEGDDD